MLPIFIFTFPIWAYHTDGDWKDGSIYPSYQLRYLPLWASTLLEAIGLAILWSAVGMELGYKLQTRNWYLTIAFLLIMVLETVQTLSGFFYACLGTDPTFSLNPGRALLVLLIERRYENYLGYILRVMPKFAMLLAGLGVMVAAYTALGFQIFSPTSPEASAYFDTYGDGLWNMFMVMNSSNWPSPMIPAINENRSYFFYFMVFIIIVDWGMINLVLGFVYMFFRVEQEDITSRYDKNKFVYLQRAFHLLDIDQKGHLTYAETDRLLLELYTYYVQTLSPPTEDERYELIMQLDTENTQQVTMEQFRHVISKCHVIALKEYRAKKNRFFRYINAKRHDSTNLMVSTGGPGTAGPAGLGAGRVRSISSAYVTSKENVTESLKASMQQPAAGAEDSMRSEDVESALHHTLNAATEYGGIENPRILERYYSHSIRMQSTDVPEGQWVWWRILWSKAAYFIDTKRFDLILDTLLAITAFAIFGAVTSEGLVIFYAVVSCLEAIAKLLVKGRYRYRRSNKNCCDGGITLIILCTLLISGNTSHLIAPNVAILWVILLRTLLFPRNIINMKVFTLFRHKHRYAFRSAFKASSHILFLLLFTVIMLYWFAAIGQQLFGGVIRKQGGSSADIENSSYGANSYWPLNFNDMPSGIITMFVLLHVNNMHVTTAGFVAATSQYAEIFFTAWYVIGVLLLLNILIAVFLNQFVEYLQTLQEQEKRAKAKEDAAAEAEVIKQSAAAPEPTSSKYGSIEDDPSMPTPSAASNFTRYGISIDRFPDDKHALRRTSTEPVTSEEPDGIRSLAYTKEQLRSPPRPVKSVSPQSKVLSAGLRNTFSSSLFASPAEREKLMLKMQAHTPKARGLAPTERSFADIPSERKVQASVDSETSSQPSVDKYTMNAIQMDIFNKEKAFKKKHKAGLGQSLLDRSASPGAAVTTRPFFGMDSAKYVAKFVVAGTGAVADEEAATNAYDSDEDTHGFHHDLDEPIYVDLELMVKRLGTASEEEGHTAHSVHQVMKRAAVSVDHQERASASGRDDSISAHETSILKHLNQRHLPAQPISSSLFDLMYGHTEISAYEKAAILVQFARDGEEHHIFSNKRSLSCYKWRNKLSYVFKVLAFVYVILRFWERALWTYDHDQWDNDHIYPNAGISVLPDQTLAIIKLPILLGMLLGLLLEWGYKESGTFMQAITPNRCLRLFLILYTAFVILVMLVELGNGFADPKLMAITAEGGVMYVLWFNRRSLQKFRLVLNIIPRFSVFLLVFLLVVLIFAGFGPPIYDLKDVADDDADNYYFHNFSESVWSVFTAITSTSYPNQIMPAYREWRDVCLYFVSFITIGSFGLLNMIIVIVLVEFQRGTQLLTDSQRITRQILLMRAFEVLDKQCEGVIAKEQVGRLLDELYDHYADFKKAGIPKGYARKLLIDILDVDGDGKISMEDFLFLLDVVRIKLSLDTKCTFFEAYFPQAAATDAFQAFKRMVTTRTFDICIDVLGAALLMISLLVNREDVFHPTTSSITITIVIVIAYAFEMIAKLIVRGYSKYVRSFRNMVDCTITILSILSLIVASAKSSLYDINPSTMALKILLMVRLVLLPRNVRLLVDYSQQMTKLARLIRRVIGKITTISIVFLCTGYIFASLGILLFGGKIRKVGGPDDLYSSDYAIDGYWPLNFNDFASASMTLFSCLKVSDFDIITTGFTSTTSNWARLYFTVWYIVGVLLFLNIIKAFFLGEFLLLFGRAGFVGTAPGMSKKSATAPAVAQDETGRSLSFASNKNMVKKHIRTQVVERMKEGFEIDASDVHNPIVTTTESAETVALEEAVNENYFPQPDEETLQAEMLAGMSMGQSWTNRDTFMVEARPHDEAVHSVESEESMGKSFSQNVTSSEDGLELEDKNKPQRRASGTEGAPQRRASGTEGLRFHASTTAIKVRHQTLASCCC